MARRLPSSTLNQPWREGLTLDLTLRSTVTAHDDDDHLRAGGSLGLRADTLRYYERIGLLRPAGGCTAIAALAIAGRPRTRRRGLRG
jgi:hypothetical protein